MTKVVTKINQPHAGQTTMRLRRRALRLMPTHAVSRAAPIPPHATR